MHVPLHLRPQPAAPLKLTGAKPPTAPKLTTPKQFVALLDNHLSTPEIWAGKLAESFKKLGPQVGQTLKGDAHAMARQFAPGVEHVSTMPLSGGESKKRFGDATTQVVVFDRNGVGSEVHVQDLKHPGFELMVHADPKGKVISRAVTFSQSELNVRWASTPGNEQVFTSADTPYGRASQQTLNGTTRDRVINNFFGKDLQLRLDLMAANGAEPSLVVSGPPGKIENILATQRVANQLGRKVVHQGELEKFEVRPQTAGTPAGQGPYNAYLASVVESRLAAAEVPISKMAAPFIKWGPQNGKVVSGDALTLARLFDSRLQPDGLLPSRGAQADQLFTHQNIRVAVSEQGRGSRTVQVEDTQRRGLVLRLYLDGAGKVEQRIVSFQRGALQYQHRTNVLNPQEHVTTQVETEYGTAIQERGGGKVFSRILKNVMGEDLVLSANLNAADAAKSGLLVTGRPDHSESGRAAAQRLADRLKERVTYIDGLQNVELQPQNTHD